MYPEAYKEWLELFDDSLAEVWQTDRKELKKSAMLFSALQQELQNVKINVEIEISNIRQQLKLKDTLKERKHLSTSPKTSEKKVSSNSGNKENEYNSTKLDQRATTCSQTLIFDDTESPDPFSNILNTSNVALGEKSAIIDLSISDEDESTPELEHSPTIKKRRRNFKKRISPKSPTFGFSIKFEEKITNHIPSNKNDGQELDKEAIFDSSFAGKPENDMSIIDCTPEVRPKKIKSSTNTSEFLSKKSKMAKGHNNTLTQMFRRKSKVLFGKDDVEMKKEEDHDDEVDSDETYFEVCKERSKMGITDLIHYINEDGTSINGSNRKLISQSNADETDIDMAVTSSQESDQLSKGGLLEETDMDSPINVKAKPVYPEAEPVVRGNARKQLRGWACEQCRQFYSHMNLSPKELQKRMDECSKHRYKYGPRDETVPGFWDLTIPPERPG